MRSMSQLIRRQRTILHSCLFTNTAFFIYRANLYRPNSRTDKIVLPCRPEQSTDHPEPSQPKARMSPALPHNLAEIRVRESTGCLPCPIYLGDGLLKRFGMLSISKGSELEKQEVNRQPSQTGTQSPLEMVE